MKVPKSFTIEQYGLKATFFSSRIETENYLNFGQNIESTLKKYGESINWESYEKYGIDEEIYLKIKGKNFSISEYLCHPNILSSNPKTLRYYRCIAAMPQKGLKATSSVSNIEDIENGSNCNAERALKLSIAINSNLNFVYRTGNISREKRKAIFFATAGATLDGSWRNAIGQEGERFIRSLIIEKSIENDELSSITLRDGTVLSAEEIASSKIEEIYVLCHSAMFKNGSTVVFGSEPDVTCQSPDGAITAGVEVKAGLDPAGALERLGAMLKSFEHLRAQSPGAETILVASCITDEVQRRLNSTRNVSRIFVLTDIVQSSRTRAQFANLIRSCLSLTDRPL